MTSSNIKPLISRNKIRERTEEIAIQINRDYSDKDDVVLLCVLKGAVNFFTDLVMLLDFDLSYEFVGLSSYEGTESSGVVKITTTLPDLNNKNVIVVEDIVDTGLSMARLKSYISLTSDIKDLKVCTLLDKPSRRKINFKPDYTCFEIKDLFVVGYGLDFNEKYRNLDFIGVYNG